MHRHTGWAVGHLAVCKEAGKGCDVCQCNALCRICIGEDIWGHTSHLIYSTCCSNNNLWLLTWMETRCSLHFGRLTHKITTIGISYLKAPL